MKRGFTLVELMIVIAIIGLLSGIIITSLTGSKAKSRDARRVSDVNQIQLAMEQYFDRCGQYPLTITPANNDLTKVSNGCPSGINLGSYISVIPKDPVGTNTNYDYVINNNTYPTDYVIHTKLETQNAAQQNSYPKSVQAQVSWATPTTAGFTCYDPNAAVATAPGYLDYCISTK